MDPATPGAETLALAARLTALTRELAPIRETYREWAREYEQTGIPRNRTEFSALVDRMKDVQDQLRDVRTALAAIAAGAETEQLRAELAELRRSSRETRGPRPRSGPPSATSCIAAPWTAPRRRRAIRIGRRP